MSASSVGLRPKRRAGTRGRTGIIVCRFRRTSGKCVRRRDTTPAAEPRAKLSRRGRRRVLEVIAVRHLIVARGAEAPGWRITTPPPPSWPESSGCSPKNERRSGGRARGRRRSGGRFSRCGWSRRRDRDAEQRGERVRAQVHRNPIVVQARAVGPDVFDLGLPRCRRLVQDMDPVVHGDQVAGAGTGVERGQAWPRSMSSQPGRGQGAGGAGGYGSVADIAEVQLVTTRCRWTSRSDRV